MSKYVSAGARISNCGRYRYRLWREWRLTGAGVPKWRWWKDDQGQPVLDGAGKPIGEPETCLFVLLNPSTADGETDDPTVRKCVGFTQRWGYDRMEIVNLFGYRATNPRELLNLGWRDNPVGDDNSRVIKDAVAGAHKIVCAWGVHGAYLDQDQTFIGWLPPDAPLFCIGDLTKDGHPRHPLYVPYSAEPRRFTPRALTR